MCHWFKYQVLINETQQEVVMHIGLNGITTINFKELNIEDIAQTIINCGFKCKFYWVSWITISSVLTRKSTQPNQIFGKVNSPFK